MTKENSNFIKNISSMNDKNLMYLIFFSYSQLPINIPDLIDNYPIILYHSANVLSNFYAHKFLIDKDTSEATFLLKDMMTKYKNIFAIGIIYLLKDKLNEIIKFKNEKIIFNKISNIIFPNYILSSYWNCFKGDLEYEN